MDRKIQQSYYVIRYYLRDDKEIEGADGNKRIESRIRECEEEIDREMPIGEWITKNPKAEIPRLANVLVYEKDKHGFIIVHKNYI